MVHRMTEIPKVGHKKVISLLEAGNLNQPSCVTMDLHMQFDIH